MGGITPIYSIPYPTGTDRVADGDNAMQALAEKVEAILGGGLPGGIKTAAITANASNGTGSIDVPGLYIDATLVAGRKYRCQAMLRGNMIDATGFLEFMLIVNGVQAAGMQSYGSAATGSSASPFVIVSPSSTAFHTFQVRVACNVGRVQVSAAPATPCAMTLECVG